MGLTLRLPLSAGGVGGDGAGVDVCKDSLDGPFCVLCRGGVGHYYDKDDKTCYECGADTR